MPVAAFQVRFDRILRFADFTANAQRNESNSDVDPLNTSLDDRAVFGILDTDRLTYDTDL